MWFCRTNLSARGASFESLPQGTSFHRVDWPDHRWCMKLKHLDRHDAYQLVRRIFRVIKPIPHDAASQGKGAISLNPGVISPSTPSGMQPVYTKLSASKRRKRPGRKVGHQGVRRERPERIDCVQEHRLESCPHCHSELRRCDRIRRRYTEDIP